MKIIRDIYYTAIQTPWQRLDLYLPEQETFPVFIYFHGGGFEGGDKSGYKFIPQLVNNGIAVISANYRLYPNAAFPDFIRDGAAAVAWACKHMPNYGNVTGFFVGGSSAGGYLTQMLCFDKKYLKMHKIDSDTLSGYIMDAGQPTVHFNILVERGLDRRRVVIDEAAPLYHISEGRSYAPMQIILADNDMKNRFEQTQLMISTLKHLGCKEDKIDYRVIPNSKHHQYVNRLDENGHSEFAQTIFEFINAHC